MDDEQRSAPFATSGAAARASPLPPRTHYVTSKKSASSLRTAAGIFNGICRRVCQEAPLIHLAKPDRHCVDLRLVRYFKIWARKDQTRVYLSQYVEPAFTERLERPYLYILTMLPQLLQPCDPSQRLTPNSSRAGNLPHRLARKHTLDVASIRWQVPLPSYCAAFPWKGPREHRSSRCPKRVPHLENTGSDPLLLGEQCSGYLADQ